MECVQGQQRRKSGEGSGGHGYAGFGSRRLFFFFFSFPHEARAVLQTIVMTEH